MTEPKTLWGRFHKLDHDVRELANDAHLDANFELAEYVRDCSRSFDTVRNSGLEQKQNDDS